MIKLKEILTNVSRENLENVRKLNNEIEIVSKEDEIQRKVEIKYKGKEYSLTLYFDKNKEFENMNIIDEKFRDQGDFPELYKEILEWVKFTNLIKIK